LRLFSFGGYGLALVALALVVFGAIECPPHVFNPKHEQQILTPLELMRLILEQGRIFNAVYGVIEMG